MSRRGILGGRQHFDVAAKHVSQNADCRLAQILVVEDGAGARKLRRPKALDSAGCELASSNLRLGSLECVADDKGESHLRLVHAARSVMLLAKLDANDDGQLRRHAGRGTRL